VREGEGEKKKRDKLRKGKIKNKRRGLRKSEKEKK